MCRCYWAANACSAAWVTFRASQCETSRNDACIGARRATRWRSAPRIVRAKSPQGLSRFILGIAGSLCWGGCARSTWILESPILESIRAALCSAEHCATMPDAVDCDRVCHAAATPGHSGRYLENGKGKKTGCCCCCRRRRRRCRLLPSFQLGPKLPLQDHLFPSSFWQRDDASSAAVTCRHLSFSILLVSWPPLSRIAAVLPCCVAPVRLWFMPSGQLLERI